MTVSHGRYFEDVKVGEALPPRAVLVSLTSLMMYAGATWDFHRYHYDAEFVAKIGVPAPFMDGQMLGALLARDLMRWGGPDSFVRRLGYRQHGMVFAGDTILISGQVTDTIVQNNRPLVVWTLSVMGPDERVITHDATAAVELTRRPQ